MTRDQLIEHIGELAMFVLKTMPADPASQQSTDGSYHHGSAVILSTLMAGLTSNKEVFQQMVGVSMMLIMAEDAPPMMRDFVRHHFQQLHHRLTVPSEVSVEHQPTISPCDTMFRDDGSWMHYEGRNIDTGEKTSRCQCGRFPWY